MKVTLENNYLTDNDVANFARQSFNKLAENFSDENNHGLIRFLARGMKSGDWNNLIRTVLDCDNGQEAHDLLVYVRKIPEHWVPFGHPQISLRLEAPVPIARQLFKHKIGMVESEESRRYVSYEPQFYYPEYFRAAAENVKQGSSDEPMANSEYWVKLYRQHCEDSAALYMRAVKDGMCPEQARIFLPQGTEVKWVLTGSLYAFANLYNQRSDSHAQKEVRDVAALVGDIIKPLYPVSWAALTEGDY